MYTKGSLLAGRLDAARPESSGVCFDAHGEEFYGECRAHGVRPKITAQMIEAWGEAEWERRTEGNFTGLATCETCHERVSVMGGCSCGNVSPEDRMFSAVFGTPPPVSVVAEPAITGVPAETRKTDRPISTEETPMPTSALMDMPPEDATPEEVAEWRKRFLAMKARRDDFLANTYREYRSIHERD